MNEWIEKYVPLPISYSNYKYVYARIERANFVDLSFGDTAVFREKWQKIRFFCALVTLKVCFIGPVWKIFDFAVFSRDISENVTDEKGPTLSIRDFSTFLPLYSAWNGPLCRCRYSFWFAVRWLQFDEFYIFHLFYLISPLIFSV